MRLSLKKLCVEASYEGLKKLCMEASYEVEFQEVVCGGII